jgi:hypothetical protein
MRSERGVGIYGIELGSLGGTAQRNPGIPKSRVEQNVVGEAYAGVRVQPYYAGRRPKNKGAHAPLKGTLRAGSLFREENRCVHPVEAGFIFGDKMYRIEFCE